MYITMYDKIKSINKLVEKHIKHLGINKDDYSQEDIKKLIMVEEIYNCLKDTFLKIDHISKKNLDICNKIVYT